MSYNTDTNERVTVPTVTFPPDEARYAYPVQVVGREGWTTDRAYLDAALFGPSHNAIPSMISLLERESFDRLGWVPRDRVRVIGDPRNSIVYAGGPLNGTVEKRIPWRKQIIRDGALYEQIAPGIYTYRPAPGIYTYRPEEADLGVLYEKMLDAIDGFLEAAGEQHRLHGDAAIADYADILTVRGSTVYLNLFHKYHIPKENT